MSGQVSIRTYQAIYLGSESLVDILFNSVTLIAHETHEVIISRPGVAGAVLQTASSLIN